MAWWVALTSAQCPACATPGPSAGIGSCASLVFRTSQTATEKAKRLSRRRHQSDANRRTLCAVTSVVQVLLAVAVRDRVRCYLPSCRCWPRSTSASPLSVRLMTFCVARRASKTVSGHCSTCADKRTGCYVSCVGAIPTTRTSPTRWRRSG